MSSSYLQKFNQTFDEFVSDLMRVFPSDPEFHMYHAAVKMATMLDERITQRVFHDRVVVPYGEQILSRNEAFFLSHNYDDLKKEDESAEHLINKVKNCYMELNEENREIVWKYFRVLVLLDRKITT